MARKCNYYNELSEIIVDNGFTVTPTKGKVPVVRHWQNPKPTDRQWLAKMLKADRYAGHNLGIVCGRVVGIDLDADDPAKAELLEALAIEHLGSTTFKRIGRPPRSLLLYRPAEGENIPSIKIADCIDVLSSKKQFVAFGIHPDTGLEYQWIGNDPTTARLDDLPIITSASVRVFAEAVSSALGAQAPAPVRQTAASVLKSRQRARQGELIGAYDGRIVRDDSGRVVDGREAFMAKMIAAEYAKDAATSPDNLADRVWQRFIAEADLSRPKGSNQRQRWSYKDALAKARSTCRRKPKLVTPRRSRRGHPASDLHAWRKPGYWTRVLRERHVAAVEQRIKTPIVLVVARVMIDAVDMATGFCTIPIAEIAKRGRCSTRSVTKARAELSKLGFWIAGPSGVFVPIAALNSNQAVDRKRRKAVRGNSKVPSLYHLSTVSAASSPLPSAAPSMTAIASKPYQPDMWVTPIVDLDAERYRRGIIPADLMAAVRAEIRARGVTQDQLAAELGISQPQIANALAGRFGLSPEPAARLLAWLQRAAA